jgi:hypothetical protein
MHVFAILHLTKRPMTHATSRGGQRTFNKSSAIQVLRDDFFLISKADIALNDYFALNVKPIKY